MVSKPEILADIEATVQPRQRLFETGEMKLLVLHFIAQQPKYSYDIIKDIAAVVGGNYKPSTGTICPTINYLEEQGFTEVQISHDDRKQYHINTKGLAHLKTHQQRLENTFNRFNTRKKIQDNADLIDVKQALQLLKSALRQHLQHDEISQNVVKSIAENIQLAAQKIKDL